MNRTERFYRIDQLLRERRVVSLESFLDVLEVSRATFKRDIEYLRDRLHAPIEWDRAAGGYRFSSEASSGPIYELPGLWFSATELYALLAAQKLLADLEPSLLLAHIAPLQARLSELLTASGHSTDEIAARVRLLSSTKRKMDTQFFGVVAQAVLARQQLQLTAWNRGRDEVQVRVVSPQRLVHYRDNWYLDAYCHLRGALRSFSLDTLRAATLLDEAAWEMSEAQLNAHFSGSYGIFSGGLKDWAVLHFSAERTRWVESECWHREQRGEHLVDGSYRLHVPYSDERELLMDILRHGAHVEVEAPASLRNLLADEAKKLAALYPL
jgi:predicted DNA-binding transcriptional regulator YafY